MKISNQQKGVSAIEFAILLPAVVVFFYVVVSYSINFAYLITLNSLAAEGARTGVSAYTTESQNRYDVDMVTQILADLVESSWIPSGRIRGCEGPLFTVQQTEGMNILSVCLSADLPLPALRPFTMEGPLQASAAVRLGSLP